MKISYLLNILGETLPKDRRTRGVRPQLFLLVLGLCFLALPLYSKTAKKAPPKKEPLRKESVKKEPSKKKFQEAAPIATISDSLDRENESQADDLAPSSWGIARDIFQPYAAKARQKQKIDEQKAQVVKLNSQPGKYLPEVTGIMFSPDNKHVAIVGRNIVHVGDMVEDYLVKKIEKTFVILKRGEKEYKLYVTP